jgi:hypothetical protein
LRPRESAKLPVLQDERAPVEGATRRVGQVLRCERLLDEIVGALPHRLHRKLHVTVAGDQDNGNVGIDFADASHQRHAVHAGHADIRNDDAVEAVAQLVDHAFRPVEAPHFKAREVERLRRRAAQFLLVIDKQDLPCAHSAASRTGIRSA